jgi:hypothetical protein
LQDARERAEVTPKRGQPLEKRSALGAGPCAPGPILLVDNYVAFTATDISSNAADPDQAPVHRSYGGNFAYYVQHKVVGNIGPTGALHGGIRAQVESHAIGHPEAPTNDPVAFYGGVYNGGTGLGAFGFHIDAYHAGVAEGRHSTYGMSVELWKKIAGGVTAGYIIRSQDAYPIDFGFCAMNVGQGVGFKRLLQAGTPPFEQGGPVGSPGQVIPFDMGVDLSWGKFKNGAAVQIPAGASVIFSAYPQPQDAPPVRHCHARWNEQTGVWELCMGDSPRFGVNMSDGRLLVSERAISNGRLNLWVAADDGSLRRASVAITFVV